MLKALIARLVIQRHQRGSVTQRFGAIDLAEMQHKLAVDRIPARRQRVDRVIKRGAYDPGRLNREGAGNPSLAAFDPAEHRLLRTITWTSRCTYVGHLAPRGGAATHGRPGAAVVRAADQASPQSARPDSGRAGGAHRLLERPERQDRGRCAPTLARDRRPAGSPDPAGARGARRLHRLHARRAGARSAAADGAERAACRISCTPVGRPPTQQSAGPDLLIPWPGERAC